MTTDPWHDINPQNPDQMVPKPKTQTTRPDQAKAGSSTKRDFVTNPAKYVRDEHGLVITHTTMEMRKRLIPQRKKSNAQLMQRLESVREPLVQDEPGSNG